jgi:hypothetical protein
LLDLSEETVTVWPCVAESGEGSASHSRHASCLSRLDAADRAGDKCWEGEGCV